MSGFDALNALYMTTYEIDEKHGTSYFKRLEEYLKKIQEENFMLVGGMTDPKGDRSKRPSEQADPDLFTRVVEKRKDGVVIRGAKAHQTGAVNSHEIMIMPTQAMGPGDEAYAIVAAIPLNAKGITMIFGRQTNEERKIECGIDAGNCEFGMVGGEALVVLEDVFVPWERVFMCGEADFTGTLVERFATMHRQNYGGCKGGVADIIVGASALAAQYQGTLGCLPCQGQARRDDAPGRDGLLGFGGLLGPGHQDEERRLLPGSAARQLHEAQHHPAHLRNLAAGPRRGWRDPGHAALRSGPETPRDRQVRGEIHEGRRAASPRKPA